MKPAGSHSVWWPVEPDRALEAWQTYHMTALQPFAPTGRYGSSITYQRHIEKIPTWAILLAIFTFPIGLIFLLAKERGVQHITVSFAPASPGTWVTASGLVLPYFQEYLDWTARQMQPPEIPLHLLAGDS